MTHLTRRTVLVGVILFLAVGGAFLIELLLSMRSERLFGHTQQGHLAGWAGLALILLVFVYSYRKRYGPKPGWPRGWFRVHMVAGVLGPILILIHSGAHFHALVPSLALLALVLVVLSGIIGQAVHYLALRTLHGKRHELLDQGLPEEDIEDRLRTLAAQEEAFRVWQYIHAPMTFIFLTLVVLHVGGALYFGGW